MLCLFQFSLIEVNNKSLFEKGFERYVSSAICLIKTKKLITLFLKCVEKKEIGWW